MQRNEGLPLPSRCRSSLLRVLPSDGSSSFGTRILGKPAPVNCSRQRFGTRRIGGGETPPLLLQQQLTRRTMEESLEKISVSELLNRGVTIFQSGTDKRPYILTLREVLHRIKSGESKSDSKSKILALRAETDKEKAKAIKLKLPAVMFSGEFQGRTDADLITHSGVIVLDWDDVKDPAKKRDSLKGDNFILSAWVSPSGNGVKALAAVAYPDKHRNHFEYLFYKKYSEKIDPTGVNVSRLCFESYDPDMWVREGDVVPLTRFAEKAERKHPFDRLVEWMTRQNNAFVTGERNIFVYKLAAACCRVGIDQSQCEERMMTTFVNGTDFGQAEMRRTILSAYRTNSFGSHEMSENEELVTIDGSSGEVLTLEQLEAEMPPRDIILLSDVEEDIDKIFENGWTMASTTYFPDLDKHWRWKRGDLNIIHGMPNMGKSTFYLFLALVKAVKEGAKYAIFGPECYPAHNFYMDMIESYIGCIVAKRGASEAEFQSAKRFVENHFYYIYPKDNAPTPQYIKERFLEMVIKKHVDGCIIDPWNQLDHAFGEREDQYLSKYLGEFSRFAKENDIYFAIIAHPHKMYKEGGKDYPCPTMYNLSGGAMWGNKADNVCAFHRPNFYSEPDDPTCEWHSQKIKRQKEVGKRGTVTLTYDWRTRRFYDFSGFSPLGRRPKDSGPVTVTPEMLEKMAEAGGSMEEAPLSQVYRPSAGLAPSASFGESGLDPLGDDAPF